MRRLVSTLMILAMCMSFLPAAAFSEEAAPESNASQVQEEVTAENEEKNLPLEEKTETEEARLPLLIEEFRLKYPALFDDEQVFDLEKAYEYLLSLEESLYDDFLDELPEELNASLQEYCTAMEDMALAEAEAEAELAEAEKDEVQAEIELTEAEQEAAIKEAEAKFELAEAEDETALAETEEQKSLVEPEQEKEVTDTEILLEENNSIPIN